MNLYGILKKEVLKLLYSLPINVHCSDNQILLSVSRYELQNSREVNINNTEYLSRDIGLANMILANKYIKDNIANEEVDKYSEGLWENILEDLLEEKEIRIKPSILRKENIKLVINNTGRDFRKV